jgi:hypothetical protein
MRIVDMYGREVELETALKGTMTARGESGGTIEDMREELDNIRDLVAGVIVKLVNRGDLSLIDCNDLFSFYYSVKPE